jgi:phosphoglycolate phosphatase
MSTPALLIFDVDGTLVDSAEEICATMDIAYRRCGHEPPARAQVLSIVGLSLPQAMQSLSPDITPEQNGALVDAYRDYFVEARAKNQHHTPLYDGVRDGLAALNDHPNYVLGAATGKAMRGLDHIISQHALEGVFVTKQTADLHPSKPHPAMIEAAMAETGINAARTVMIGDTSFDMEMGKAAGVRTIAVSWGYHDRARLMAAGCDAIADGFDDLQAIVHHMFGDAA